jgi:multicomponent Na+:H+ antiporter subunit C
MVIGILFTGATYLLLRRSMLRVLFGLVLLGHGVSLVILTMGRYTSQVAPIIEEQEEADAAGIPAAGIPAAGQAAGTLPTADPQPQVMVITALIIAFAFLACMVVLIYRTYQAAGQDDMAEMTTTDRP